MIRIHNMRDSEPEPGNARHVYIGRRGRLPASPLANPYRIGVHGERAEVVAKYRAWLPNDPPALAEVARLAELARTGDLDLWCWCAPALCHGDVVKEAIAQLLNQTGDTDAH